MRPIPCKNQPDPARTLYSRRQICYSQRVFGLATKILIGALLLSAPLAFGESCRWVLGRTKFAVAYTPSGALHLVPVQLLKNKSDSWILMRKQLREESQKTAQRLRELLISHQRSDLVPHLMRYAEDDPTDFMKWSEYFEENPGNVADVRRSGSIDWDETQSWLEMVAKRIDQDPLMASGIRIEPPRTCLNCDLLSELESSGRLVHMNQLETSFDVIARKSTVEKGVIHEVDNAFAFKGIADQRVRVQESGVLEFGWTEPLNRVYAWGHQSAIRFDGKYSLRSRERYHAVIFEKNFIVDHAINLTSTSHSNPSWLSVRNQGKIFIKRAESGRSQVHIFNFKRIQVGDETLSVFELLRNHAIAVVEFDNTGEILEFKRLR